MKTSHCFKRGRNCSRPSTTSFRTATGDLPGSQPPESLPHPTRRHWMKFSTPSPPLTHTLQPQGDPKQIFPWALTGLQIPVHDPVKVAVLHARDNLLEYRPGLVRIKPALRHDVIEQFSPGNVLLKRNNDKMTEARLLCFACVARNRGLSCGGCPHTSTARSTGVVLRDSRKMSASTYISRRTQSTPRLASPVRPLAIPFPPGPAGRARHQ